MKFLLRNNEKYNDVYYYQILTENLLENKENIIQNK